MAFIGKFDGQFVDNVKYFFLFMQHSSMTEYDIFFVTENRDVMKKMQKYGYNVFFYPTLKSIVKLVTAQVLIVDHIDWIKKCKYHLLFKSKKVQLWHGIGLKYIEKEINDSKKYKSKPLWARILVSIYRVTKGRFSCFDLIISTSEFYTKQFFKKPFNYKEIIETGYPRNDILIPEQKMKNKDDKKYYIETDYNIIEMVQRLKLEGNKIVLYAPTYRDTGRTPLGPGSFDPKYWSDFGQRHKTVFVIKSHPYPEQTFSSFHLKNILHYSHSKDVYPLLPCIDLLITDYSSIYTDFLLLEKPIIFFCYDYEKYVREDRDLKPEYEWITPGPKCSTTDALEEHIRDVLFRSKDLYIEKRTEIKELSFKYQDNNSSERIWETIREKYL